MWLVCVFTSGCVTLQVWSGVDCHKCSIRWNKAWGQGGKRQVSGLWRQLRFECGEGQLWLGFGEGQVVAPLVFVTIKALETYQTGGYSSVQKKSTSSKALKKSLYIVCISFLILIDLLHLTYWSHILCIVWQVHQCIIFVTNFLIN